MRQRGPRNVHIKSPGPTRPITAGCCESVADGEADATIWFGEDRTMRLSGCNVTNHSNTHVPIDQFRNLVWASFTQMRRAAGMVDAQESSRRPWSLHPTLSP